MKRLEFFILLILTLSSPGFSSEEDPEHYISISLAGGNDNSRYTDIAGDFTINKQLFFGVLMSRSKAFDSIQDKEIQSRALALSLSHEVNQTFTFGGALAFQDEDNLNNSTTIRIFGNTKVSDLWQGKRITSLYTELGRTNYRQTDNTTARQPGSPPSKTESLRAKFFTLGLSQEINSWLSLYMDYTKYKYSLSLLEQSSLQNRRSNNRSSASAIDRSWGMPEEILSFKLTLLPIDEIKVYSSVARSSLSGDLQKVNTINLGFTHYIQNFDWGLLGTKVQYESTSDINQLQLNLGYQF